MKKILALTLTIAMMTGMLTGCASAKTAAPEQTKEAEPAQTEADKMAEPEATEAAPVKMDKVVVGYMPNYGSLCSVIAGMELGNFKDQGIEVELVEFADGPTIIAAMESGSVDVGYIGPGAHKLCIEGRALIFSISHTGNGDLIIGNGTKGIQSMADLKGKIVAFTSATSSETVLDTTLKENNMTKDDIQAMDMDPSAIVTAMLSGSIDACASWAPGTTKIQETLGEDAVILNNIENRVPDIASWIVQKPYYEKNQDVVLRFTKALFLGMEYRAQESNYEQVSEWVAKQVAQDVTSVLPQAMASGWMSASEAMTMLESGDMKKAYEGQQKNFREAGTITVADVPVDDYVLFQNMKDASVVLSK